MLLHHDCYNMSFVSINKTVLMTTYKLCLNDVGENIHAKSKGVFVSQYYTFCFSICSN